MRSKVFFAFVLSVITSCLSLHAQTVSPEAARAKAMDFFSTGAKNLPARKGAIRKAPAVSNVELAYTSEKDGKPCFYVYNNGTDGGFVIVGGDEVAQEILAYVPQGHFDYDKVPDNVKWWLGLYEQEISTTSQALQKSAPKRATSSNRNLFTDIPDMITTKWDQGFPYNAAIPEIQHTNGSSFACPTGCVPTAVAQIMNYWKWPISGEGSYNYTLNYDELDEESAGANQGDYNGLLPATFSANFRTTTYDWENMSDNYDGTNTQDQIDAVSTLMYHVGVAGKTTYGPSNSGSGNPIEILKKNFRYSERMSFLLRGDYLDDEWEEIIYSELQKGRPVYYEGEEHAFIIHGYSSELNMFSVNWGWGGHMDGFFKVAGTEEGFFKNEDYYKEDWLTNGILIHFQPNNIDYINTFTEIGDTIDVDGIRYDLIGPFSKTVEVTSPHYEEPGYSGDITIPETIVYNDETYTVTKVGRWALSSSGEVFLGTSMGAPVNDITSIHLPNTIRSIARGGFCQSEYISELTIPENVEMIGENCFSGMSKLSSITLSSHLTFIPHLCFSNCGNLDIINIPASIKAIGRESFARLTHLEFLVMNAPEVPSIGEYSPFDQEVQNKTLVVPYSSIDAYRNDPEFGRWGNIIPLDSLPVNYGKRFEKENLVYQIEREDAKVKLVGYNGHGDNVDLVIPSSVTYNGMVFTVDNIGVKAFENKEFRSVAIEDGIQALQENAFCKNCFLQNIKLPSTLKTIGAHAFEQCSRLKEIDIPSSVTTIGDCAFRGCNQLKEIDIPSSVTTIDGNAFNGCSALESIHLPDSMSVIGYGCFANCESLKELTIPNGIKYLGTIIYGWNSIQKITLPSSIERLGSCFGSCSKLSYLYCYSEKVPDVSQETFPTDIKQGVLFVPKNSIEAYASAEFWKDWGSIEAIEMAEETHYLGESFEVDGIKYTVQSNGVIVEKCITRQSEIVIPQQVEYKGESFDVLKIGTYAFLNYDEDDVLKSVILPEGLKVIEKSAFENCFHLKQINLPESLDEIGNGAFGSCRELDNVRIPSSITKIESGTFSYCCNLKNIWIGNNVKSIETFAFMATGLTSISLPNSVKEINDYAFYQCQSLTNSYCYSAIVPTAQLNAFDEVDLYTRTLYVPAESVNAYRTSAPWSDYGTILPIISIESIQLADICLKVSSQKALSIQVQPTNATEGQIFYSSSNPKVATISHDGKITAHEVGKAVITAETMDGKIATCTVTVKAGTVGTLVDAIDGLPSGRTTLQDVDDAVDSILER